MNENILIDFIPPKNKKCHDSERECSKCFWCRNNGKEYVCTIDMCHNNIMEEMKTFWR